MRHQSLRARHRAVSTSKCCRTGHVTVACFAVLPQPIGGVGGIVRERSRSHGEAVDHRGGATRAVHSADATERKTHRSERIRRLTGRTRCHRAGDASVFRFAATSRSGVKTCWPRCLDGGTRMCLASHRTAAALHGFDGFHRTSSRCWCRCVSRHRRKNVIVHHTRRCSAADRTSVGLDPGHDASGTLIDLGAVAPPTASRRPSMGRSGTGRCTPRRVERPLPSATRARAQRHRRDDADPRRPARRSSDPAFGARTADARLLRAPDCRTSRSDCIGCGWPTARAYETRLRLRRPAAGASRSMATEVTPRARQRAADNVRVNALERCRLDACGGSPTSRWCTDPAYVAAGCATACRRRPPRQIALMTTKAARYARFSDSDEIAAPGVPAVSRWRCWRSSVRCSRCCPGADSESRRL